MKLREKFPDATEEQVTTSAAVVVNKINDLRGLTQQLNMESHIRYFILLNGLSVSLVCYSWTHRLNIGINIKHFSFFLL